MDETPDQGRTVSLVLFSGTDDKLNAAAVLAVGAAAMGRRVNVFLQYWALDAFRSDRITEDHGVSPEAGPEGAQIVRRHAGQHWSEILRQAKDIGDLEGIQDDGRGPMGEGQTGVFNGQQERAFEVRMTVDQTRKEIEATQI